MVLAAVLFVGCGKTMHATQRDPTAPASSGQAMVAAVDSNAQSDLSNQHSWQFVGHALHAFPEIPPSSM